MGKKGWLLGLLDGSSDASTLRDEQLDSAIVWLNNEGLQHFDEAQFEQVKQTLRLEWLQRGPTLRLAHVETMAGAAKGVDCPCCGRFVKRYGNRLNANRVKSLIWLCQQSDDWIHVPEEGPRWLVKTNQHPTLCWWGLVERKPDSPGYYRATNLGREFISGRAKVPSKVHTFNGSVVGTSGDLIGVHEAIGDAFSLENELAPTADGAPERIPVTDA